MPIVVIVVVIVVIVVVVIVVVVAVVVIMLEPLHRQSAATLVMTRSAFLLVASTSSRFRKSLASTLLAAPVLPSPHSFDFSSSACSKSQFVLLICLLFCYCCLLRFEM
ncbi:unnamed protein product [Polarella glacialis]|uniref:Uncharacterized protein n=1 Tax=Polarella glacialis TaxID=89957 RepID=A0A813HGC8_POLGL|nr:unnamed protein product [Polarella glacialis]